MQTLTVTRPDGTTFDTTVSDDVKTMPDDQREQLFHDILQADAQRRATAPDTSFGAALRYGAAAPLTGAADTADIAGAPKIAGALRSAASSIGSSNYSPAAPQVAANLRQGNYGEALEYAPRAIAEGLGQVGGYLGAAGVGAEVGGPVGAVALPLAAGVATTYGPNVKARAAANHEASPSTSDYLGAIPGTAAEAALNTVGAGAGPIGRAVTDAVPGILAPAARMALDAAGTGTANLAGQAGRTLGTAQGLTVDPYEAATAAIQGAGGRGVAEVQGGAKAAVGAAGDAITRRGLDDLTPDEAASVLRVNGELDQARANARNVTGRDLPDTTLLNNVKQSKAALVRALGRQLLDDGYVSQDDYRTLVMPAMEQAQRHNNVLTDGPGTAFGELQQLDVPQEKLQPLVNGLRDLNTVSNQSLIKNTKGPFQTLGGIVGQGGALLSAGLSGNTLEMAAALAGHGIAGKLGSGIGSAADRLFGTNKPPIVLQQQRAAQILRQVRQAAGDSSNAQMFDALTHGQDDREALAAQLGLMGAAAARYAPRPDLSVTMTPAQVLDLEPMQQAHLADLAGITVRELTQGAQQGLTPSQVTRGRDLLERASDRVSGMAYRNDEWPNPQVTEANFVNTDGMAGMPNMGFTTPGVIQGDATIVGRPSASTAPTQQPIQPAPLSGVKQPGIPAGPIVQARIAQAFKTAKEQMDGSNTQAMRSGHAAMMAATAAEKARVSRAVNEGSQATARPDATAGAETKTATKPDTTDQVAANGGAKAPDQLAAAKAKAAANAPAGGFGSGWKAYVHRGLKDHGISADMSDIHAAVDTLAENGHLNDLFPDGIGAQAAAQIVKQHKGDLRGPIGREVIRRVAAQIAADKGQAHKLDQEPAGVAPNLGTQGAARAAVYDPFRWQAAARVAQAHGSALAAAARANGHHSTEPVILAVRDEPNATKKAAMRDAHLMTLPASQRPMVAQYFTPNLMRGI